MSIWADNFEAFINMKYKKVVSLQSSCVLIEKINIIFNIPGKTLLSQSSHPPGGSEEGSEN